jgi:hypothetical protein
MIGHQYVSQLAAAEHRQALRSAAELYHASQARAAKRAQRRPSVVLLVVRRLAHLRRPTPAAAKPTMATTVSTVTDAAVTVPATTPTG